MKNILRVLIFSLLMQQTIQAHFWHWFTLKPTALIGAIVTFFKHHFFPVTKNELKGFKKEYEERVSKKVQKMRNDFSTWSVNLEANIKNVQQKTEGLKKQVEQTQKDVEERHQGVDVQLGNLEKGLEGTEQHLKENINKNYEALQGELTQHVTFMENQCATIEKQQADLQQEIQDNQSSINAVLAETKQQKWQELERFKKQLEEERQRTTDMLKKLSRQTDNVVQGQQKLRLVGGSIDALESNKQTKAAFLADQRKGIDQVYQQVGDFNSRLNTLEQRAHSVDEQAQVLQNEVKQLLDLVKNSSGVSSNDSCRLEDLD